MSFKKKRKKHVDELDNSKNKLLRAAMRLHNEIHRTATTEKKLQQQQDTKCFASEKSHGLDEFPKPPLLDENEEATIDR